LPYWEESGRSPPDAALWIPPERRGIWRRKKRFDVLPCEWHPYGWPDAVRFAVRGDRLSVRPAMGSRQHPGRRSVGCKRAAARDTVDVLDRLFLVQYDQGRPYLPRRPEVALGLAGSERAGTWSLIRADGPVEAFMHARNVVIGSGCSRRGPCAQCAATTVRRGSWKEVAAALAAECPRCQPLRVPDVRVSSWRRWPRYQLILSDGNWVLGDE
jgi:hypothetical protein